MTCSATTTAVQTVTRIPSDTTLTLSAWKATTQFLLSQLTCRGHPLFQPCNTSLSIRTQLISAISQLRAGPSSASYPLCTADHLCFDQVAGPLKFAQREQLPLLLVTRSQTDLGCLCQELQIERTDQLVKQLSRVAVELSNGPLVIKLPHTVAASKVEVPANLFVPQEHFQTPRTAHPLAITHCLEAIDKAVNPALIADGSQTGLHGLILLDCLAKERGLTLLLDGEDIGPTVDLAIYCDCPIRDEKALKRPDLRIIQITQKPEEVTDSQAKLVFAGVNATLEQLCSRPQEALQNPIVFSSDLSLARRLYPTNTLQSWMNPGWEIAAAMGTKRVLPHADIRCALDEATYLASSSDLHLLNTQAIPVTVACEEASRIKLKEHAKAFGIAAQVSFVPMPEAPAKAIRFYT